MKKILLIFILLFPVISVFAGTDDCVIDTSLQSSQTAVDFLSSCARGTGGVDPKNTANSVTGVKDLVIKVSERVIQFGALFAVGALVFAGIRYVSAFGDDEKLKKAKNTGVFALIGLILLLIAFPLVDIVVNFIYSFGS
jgi:hypothetical protein